MNIMRLPILNHPRPGEDPCECIVNNAVELDSLEKSKKSLKALFTLLVIDGNQDDLTWPDVFPHILETMVTERVWYLCKKNGTSLLETFGTPFAGLMGLINNQILMVNERRIKEIIDKITLKERHPIGENTTAVLESIQLPWRTEYTHGDVPGQVPRNIRDSATRTPSPPPVPENVVPSESLEMEINLSDRDDWRSNLLKLVSANLVLCKI